jgi:hypothetical protein
MPASKVSARVLFKVAAADAIAAKHGLKLDHEKATFFGVTQSNYSRVVTGATLVGDRFIAAVLSSRPDDPDITFDNLFEVVEVSP